MVKIKYNHPSIPRLPIDINKVYIVEKIKDKYFINIDKGKAEISLFDLKTLYKVVEGSLDNNKDIAINKKNEDYKNKIKSI